MLAAMASSALGGTAVAVTRDVVGGTADPVLLGALRFLSGAALLLPVVILLRSRGAPARRAWPRGRDLAVTILLGLLFFGLFPVLFNAALIHTTAARAALSLATMPLLTLAAAVFLGVERPTGAKVGGILIAVAGVAVTLAAGLDIAPAGAWRGDLIMVAAALCMSIYNLGARGPISRHGPMAFTSIAMTSGAVMLAAIALADGGVARLAAFRAGDWLAVIWLGVGGSAVAFCLWALALARISPGRVAAAVTVNPVTAAITAFFLTGEVPGWHLAVGLVAVLWGILLAARPDAPR